MMSGAGKGNPQPWCKVAIAPFAPSGPHLKATPPGRFQCLSSPIASPRGKQGLDWQLSEQLTLANWQLTRNKWGGICPSSSWRGLDPHRWQQAAP